MKSITPEIIPVNRIDFKDHKFQYTLKEISPVLRLSIETEGILSPLSLQRKRTRYRIVSGFKRAQLARELKFREIPAYLFEPSDSVIELFKRAILENRAVREHHPVEIARLLKKLTYSNISRQVLFEDIFPILSLKPSAELLGDYLSLANFNPKMLDFLSSIPLSLKRCMVFKPLSSELQAFFALIARENALGINFLDEIITNVTEVSRREGESVESVLSAMKIAEILRSREKERKDKIEKIRQLFYAKLKPSIKEKSGKLSEFVKTLDLPHNVSLLWDAEFEKPGYMLILKILNEEDLSAAISSLTKSELLNKLKNLLKEL